MSHFFYAYDLHKPKLVTESDSYSVNGIHTTAHITTLYASGVNNYSICICLKMYIKCTQKLTINLKNLIPKKNYMTTSFIEDANQTNLYF